MKKSTFVAILLGTVGGLLFALGMCMALIPEWEAFKPGVAMGTAGVAALLSTVLVWRKMENKAPICISRKMVLGILLGIAGALMLGIGMCFIMVWNKFLLGILIGIVGIIALISVIPFFVGLK